MRRDPPLPPGRPPGRRGRRENDMGRRSSIRSSETVPCPRQTGNEAFDHVGNQHLIDVLLDVGEELRLARGHKREGGAIFPHATGPADAMDVRIWILGHVVIDDVGNPFDVDTTSDNVRCDKIRIFPSRNAFMTFVRLFCGMSPCIAMTPRTRLPSASARSRTEDFIWQKIKHCRGFSRMRSLMRSLSLRSSSTRKLCCSIRSTKISLLERSTITGSTMYRLVMLHNVFSHGGREKQRLAILRRLAKNRSMSGRNPISSMRSASSSITVVSRLISRCPRRIISINRPAFRRRSEHPFEVLEFVFQNLHHHRYRRVSHPCHR